jgi:hypothetical protein
VIVLVAVVVMAGGSSSNIMLCSKLTILKYGLLLNHIQSHFSN